MATRLRRGSCLLRLIKWFFAAVFLFVAALWLYCRFGTDVIFACTVRGADRIVVRDGGGTCHSEPDSEPILYEITNKTEIAAFVDMFKFSGRSLRCRCCGYPGVDWWRDGKRFAVTALHHKEALRIDGFFADLRLTEESSSRIMEWLKSHCGIAENENSPRWRKCRMSRNYIECEARAVTKKCGVRPTLDELRVRFEKDLGEFPSCPIGGKYSLSYGEDGIPEVSCSEPDHSDVPKRR
ncbi:MAG: hypothetical protein K6G91_12970 [Kiritimatiellae bacterium]|nr:hypothetical protein [Kiritimatiellia bacterium]